MPRRMSDEGGQEDGTHPWLEHVRKEQCQRRHKERQDEQLTQFDAEIEREQRRQQVGSGELQRLAKRERKPEAVNETEAERQGPPPVDVGGPDDVLERHVE